jgi:tRNA A-37 threonylcarbamoyl transferase component Bud32
MSSPDEATYSHHDPLDAVIAAYLQQVEAGAVPDREALLARHPELAEGLREFFADFDRLDRQAGDLRLPGAAGESAGERPHVRYFGEYELLEVIARGGMGVVYKARQQSLHRLVALKMILQGQLATPRAVARFRAEAEAAANLDHPHIVPIYEVGEHEGQQYFTMRYIEGCSLARQPRGDLRSEVRMVATVARAVHYAHQHGILHRDIKPSNILIAGGVPFVTDFGLAKRLDGAGELTGTGETPGTPRYMAPEQVAGRKDLTVAADVYGLGMVLYERLTGTTPFIGEDVLELLRQVREAEPPRPSVLSPGVDRDVETICLKCLEKEPGRRYGSAELLADDLERWQRGEPIEARRVGPVERAWRWCRRNPLLAATAAVALLALVGTALLGLVAAQQAQARVEEARERARIEREAAEKDRERLRRELFERARAERLAGNRWKALELLREAADNGSTDAMRQEAIQALLTPAVRLIREIPKGDKDDVVWMAWATEKLPPRFPEFREAVERARKNEFDDHFPSVVLEQDHDNYSLRDRKANRPLPSPWPRGAQPERAYLSRDGRCLAWRSRQDADLIHIWDTVRGRRGPFLNTEPGQALSHWFLRTDACNPTNPFSPDAILLAAHHHRGEELNTYLYDVPTGRVLLVVRRAALCAWDPEGRLLVTYGRSAEGRPPPKGAMGLAPSDRGGKEDGITGPPICPSLGGGTPRSCVPCRQGDRSPRVPVRWEAGGLQWHPLRGAFRARTLVPPSHRTRSSGRLVGRGPAGKRLGSQAPGPGRAFRCRAAGSGPGGSRGWATLPGSVAGSRPGRRLVASLRLGRIPDRETRAAWTVVPTSRLRVSLERNP